MSTAGYLADAATRHAVFLQRYAAGRSREVVSMLNRLRREIVGRLMDEPTVFQRARLEIVLEDVNRLAHDILGEMTEKTVTEARRLARLEAEFSAELFDKATKAEFSTPGDAQLAAVVTDPMRSLDINIPDALAQFNKKKASEITKVITDGVLLGDTTDQIAKTVSQTIDIVHRRQAIALTRTITNAASTAARDITMAENEELLQGYQFLATLDSRTTMTCAANDKRLFPISSGPRPPLHWQCRSTIVPVVKQEYDLGAEVVGERASRGAHGREPVSGHTTYGSWLRKQPKSFQAEALGEKRAKLFRDGNLKIENFVDPTGKEYNLEALRGMFPVAFEKAGL